MQDYPLPKVLILAAGAVAGQRWRDALATAAETVWLAEADIPPGESPEVVVTDTAADKWQCRAGIIAIGMIGSGDATLAPDCSDAELRLATILVAEIARLRAARDELARTHAEVRQLADTDPLTGLPNRRAWDQQLATVLASSQPTRWLAVVDLDNFKQINDRLGMAHGDVVLLGAAQALAGQLRRNDLVARIGGDEFGLLLGEMAEDNLRRVLDRLLGAVATSGEVTASIGYVSTRGAREPRDLFTSAERAMREAKRAGGNRAHPGAPVP